MSGLCRSWEDIRGQTRFKAVVSTIVVSVDASHSTGQIVGSEADRVSALYSNTSTSNNSVYIVIDLYINTILTTKDQLVCMGLHVGEVDQ